jgi:hypothetical protein
MAMMPAFKFVLVFIVFLLSKSLTARSASSLMATGIRPLRDAEFAHASPYVRFHLHDRSPFDD